MNLHFSLLLLTDGTTEGTLDLLSTPAAFCLESWGPANVGYRDGGMWNEPALAEGRRLAYRQFGNVIDVFRLNLVRGDVDLLAETTRKMQRLVEKAADYWTTRRRPSVPVYLVAQAACETYPRYAHVIAGRLDGLNDPYQQPVFGTQPGQSAQGDLTLTLEHGHWMQEPPASAACQEVSAEQEYARLQTETTSEPGQSSDDVSTPPFNLLSTDLSFGNAAGSFLESGIRFPNVTVPQGAIIQRAWITFQAAASDTGTGTNVAIAVQRIDNAGTFTDATDYKQRNWSSQLVFWGNIQDWQLNQYYDTPNLRGLIQLVVNRPGWSSGNAMALRLYDYGSVTNRFRRAWAWDGTGDEPVLHVVYSITAGAQIYGRSATCSNEVYVANKSNVANFTHVYKYDGAAYSGNLMLASLPYKLFPDPIGVPPDPDILYVGIDVGNTDSGPFDSIVFDIGTPAVYTGNARITWTYYNGAWTTLAYRDNTDNGTGAFTIAGVNSLHFEPPTDWIPTVINGVNAYWLRATVFLGTGTISPVPTQQNRHLYSIVWPSVDIAADEIGGDVSALVRLKIYNQSNAQEDFIAVPPGLWASRYLLCARAVEAGEDFRAHINFANEQNPAGVAVVPISAAFVADVTAPSGEVVRWTPAGAASDVLLTSLDFAEDIASQYYGSYRALLRIYQAGGSAGDITVYLKFRYGWAGLEEQTDPLPTEYTNRFNVLDFGKVEILPDALVTGETSDFLFIEVYASATGAGPQLTLYDLALMPVDEWSANVEVVAPPPASVSVTTTSNTPGRYVDADGIGNPKIVSRAVLRRVSSDNETGIWSVDVPVQLHYQRALRLYFYAWRRLLTGEWRADPAIAHSIQLLKNQRYRYLRGDG